MMKSYIQILIVTIDYAEKEKWHLRYNVTSNKTLLGKFPNVVLA